jgi:hypothetical protein
VVNSLAVGGWISTFNTTAGVGDKSGWATTTTELCSMESRAYVVIDFASQGLTSIRKFIGLTGTHVGAGRTGAVGTNTPTGHLLGLQVSTDRGDTTYQFLTQQSGGAQNLINTGVALVAANLMLIIDCRTALQARLSLCDANGVELASTTVTTAASLPTASAQLGAVGIIETRTTAVRTWIQRHAQVSVGQYN